MNKTQVTKMDVLSVIDELAAKGEDGKATTKAIILRLGELFPEVHMKIEFMIMMDLKKAGYLDRKSVV